MKEATKDMIPYLILLLGIVIIGLLSVKCDSKYPQKITTCRIDSIESVPKNIITQDIINKCYTSCGETFLTPDMYHVGDSIHIKTLIIK